MNDMCCVCMVSTCRPFKSQEADVLTSYANQANWRITLMPCLSFAFVSFACVTHFSSWLDIFDNGKSWKRKVRLISNDFSLVQHFLWTKQKKTMYSEYWWPTLVLPKSIAMERIYGTGSSWLLNWKGKWLSGKVISIPTKCLVVFIVTVDSKLAIATMDTGSCQTKDKDAMELKQFKNWYCYGWMIGNRS